MNNLSGEQQRKGTKTSFFIGVGRVVLATLAWLGGSSFLAPAMPRKATLPYGVHEGRMLRLTAADGTLVTEVALLMRLVTPALAVMIAEAEPNGDRGTTKPLPIRFTMRHWLLLTLCFVK